VYAIPFCPFQMRNITKRSYISTRLGYYCNK